MRTLPDTATVVQSGAACAALDQASGLRRIFERPPVSWTLDLQPSMRSASAPEALARRARQLSASSGQTVIIDAARAQVALPLGLRLRFDLEHALAGDCELSAALVGAGESLWVLPAARAIDAALLDERHALRVAAAFEAVAAGMRHAMLILPASRVSWIRHLPALARTREALMPVAQRADASASVLTAVRQAMSEAEIDTFHLLFLGMGEAAAGRLLSGMAAIAQRHFGATLLAARNVAQTQPASAQAPAGDRSVEIGF